MCDGGMREGDVVGGWRKGGGGDSGGRVGVRERGGERERWR